jgi:MSHA pilin protein MshD
VSNTARQAGISLLETVIAIVVIGIGLTSTLVPILLEVRHSADPMLVQQANAVAQSYLEEVLLKPFCDPNDFGADCAACTSAACGACTGVTLAGGGAESRGTYDDVCDYDGLADLAGARDQTGGALAGLADYRVRVAVDDTALLNGLAGVLGQVLRVDVQVVHASRADVDVRLSGYRSNH